MSDTQRPPESEREQSDLGRREFVRKLGTSLFAITLVDIADPGLSAHAQTSGCGNGTPDSTCAPGEFCTFGDGAGVDENCGDTSSGSIDPDSACSLQNHDGSCQISQVPDPVHETDENCANLNQADPDQSCGDCDDNHSADEHCGVQTAGEYDSDDLCGHQHGCVFGIEGGITTDEVCNEANPAGGAGVEPDVGCGNHCTVYGGEDYDQDESCNQPKIGGGTNPDMYCGDPGETSDENCNGSGNDSTTSPDEHCGTTGGGVLTDRDEACSHYDADEGCGVAVSGGGSDEDEACGEGWEDDPDNYCPGGNDPQDPEGDADDSDEPNETWPPPG